MAKTVCQLDGVAKTETFQAVSGVHDNGLYMVDVVVALARNTCMSPLQSCSQVGQRVVILSSVS